MYVSAIGVLYFIGIICLLLALIFLLIINHINKKAVRLCEVCLKHTDGVFNRIIERTHRPVDDCDHYGYQAEYLYEVDGFDYLYISSTVENKRDKVSREDEIIFYNPSNPNEAYIDKDLILGDTIVIAFKITITILLIVGISLLGLSLVLRL